MTPSWPCWGSRTTGRLRDGDEDEEDAPAVGVKSPIVERSGPDRRGGPPLAVPSSTTAHRHLPGWTEREMREIAGTGFATCIYPEGACPPARISGLRSRKEISTHFPFRCAAGPQPKN